MKKTTWLKELVLKITPYMNTNKDSFLHTSLLNLLGANKHDKLSTIGHN